MKKVLEFLKTLLVVVLVVTAFVGLQAFVLLNNVSKLASEKNIENMLKQVEITDLLAEEDKKEIYTELENAGIPKKYTAAVLENEKLQETVGDVVSDIVVAVINEKEIPSIDAKELTKTLQNVFDTVVKEIDAAGFTEEDIKEVHKAIEEYTPELVNYVNESKDELNDYMKENVSIKEEIESNPTMNLIYTLYQKRSLFLIGSIVSLLLIVLLKWKDFKFIKWIATILILSAVSFITISFILPVLTNMLANELAELKPLVDVSIHMMSQSYLTTGIICLVAGGLFIAAKIGLKHWKKDAPVEVTE